MRKIILVLIFMIIIVFLPVKAQVITGNISMTDRVPNGLFGDWKVISVCKESTNTEYFGLKSVDLWRLSKNGDTITLTNPLSGARADVDVSDVQGNTVKFEKKSFYPDEESIETPILTLQGDNFTGVDKIRIKTFKNGKLIKEDYVEYKVRGTKISGDGLAGIFGK